MKLISRTEAKAAGLIHYYIGLCSHGHDSQRWVRDGRCIECFYDSRGKITDTKKATKAAAAKAKTEAAGLVYITRADAEAQGLTRFCEGRWCRKGHKCERLVSGYQCVECHQGNKLNWSQDNAEQSAAATRAYYAANKETVIAKNNVYQKIKRAEDPVFKLRAYLRIRVWKALKVKKGRNSGVRDLGCTIQEFRAYIEAKFHDGMTWDNWGSVWEMDHVRRLASFSNLHDRAQFLEAFHYTNHQPLTIEEHRRKTALEACRDVIRQHGGVREAAD